MTGLPSVATLDEEIGAYVGGVFSYETLLRRVVLLLWSCELPFFLNEFRELLGSLVFFARLSNLC